MLWSYRIIFYFGSLIGFSCRPDNYKIPAQQQHLSRYAAFGEPIYSLMSKAINLKIVLQAPTPGVVYGLQKGKGSNYETVQGQVSNSNDLVFQFNIEAKRDDKGNVVFLGPYTQGTPQDRFVYIDIGTYAGQKDSPWGRRLKIPLSGINAKTLDALSEKEILECKVPGAGKDGSPNCATVKPFSGWKLADSH